MLNILKPNLVAASIYEIDLDAVWDLGYHHIIIDLDNTITAWNQHHVSPALKEWVFRTKEKGFNICLLSNNTQLKVQSFASELGVIAAAKGGKPSRKAFQSALSALQSTQDNTVIIGDQIFTDILGGNRAGLYTILVDPIDRNEFIGTRFTRIMEKLLAGRR